MVVLTIDKVQSVKLVACIHFNLSTVRFVGKELEPIYKRQFDDRKSKANKESSNYFFSTAISSQFCMEMSFDNPINPSVLNKNIKFNKV